MGWTGMGGSIGQQADDPTDISRKCGISVPIDGWADGDIQLEGLADYTVQGDGVDEGHKEDEDDMEAEMDDGDVPFVNSD